MSTPQDLDPVTWLADPVSYEIIDDWETLCNVNEIAEAYHSLTSSKLTMEEFRQELLEAPLLRKLEIHEELILADPGILTLTSKALLYLDETYNTCRVHLELFARAVLGLPPPILRELLLEARLQLGSLAETVPTYTTTSALDKAVQICLAARIQARNAREAEDTALESIISSFLVTVGSLQNRLEDHDFEIQRLVTAAQHAIDGRSVLGAVPNTIDRFQDIIMAAPGVVEPAHEAVTLVPETPPRSVGNHDRPVSFNAHNRSVSPTLDHTGLQSELPNGTSSSKTRITQAASSRSNTTPQSNAQNSTSRVSNVNSDIPEPFRYSDSESEYENSTTPATMHRNQGPGARARK